MEVICYDSIEELCENVTGCYLDFEDESVNIVAKYDEASKIVNELCRLGFNLFNIDLHDKEVNGYDDEFVISIFDDNIYCEKLKRGTSYITLDHFYSFVLDNCNSKCLEKNYSSNIVEAHICDSSCGDCIFDIDDEEENELIIEDDDVHGFKVTVGSDNEQKSISFYSTKEIDVDKIESLLKIFDL